MGNNRLVSYLAHIQHFKKPIRSEPWEFDQTLSPLLFEVKGLAMGDYYHILSVEKSLSHEHKSLSHDHISQSHDNHMITNHYHMITNHYHIIT